MAEQSGAGVPTLSTDIESGKFSEKETHPVPATKQPIEEEEEEDEDIDALIDDLESNDGHGDVSSTFLPSMRMGSSGEALGPNWRSCAKPGDFATSPIAPPLRHEDARAQPSDHAQLRSIVFIPDQC